MFASALRRSAFRADLMPFVKLSRSPAMHLLCVFVLLLWTGPARCYFPEERWSPESALLAPRVLLALVCRNSAHSLPHVLGAIDRLNYPKDRMAVWWVPADWTGSRYLSELMFCASSRLADARPALDWCGACYNTVTADLLQMKRVKVHTRERLCVDWIKLTQLCVRESLEMWLISVWKREQDSFDSVPGVACVRGGQMSEFRRVRGRQTPPSYPSIGSAPSPLTHADPISRRVPVARRARGGMCEKTTHEWVSCMNELNTFPAATDRFTFWERLYDLKCMS